MDPNNTSAGVSYSTIFWHRRQCPECKQDRQRPPALSRLMLGVIHHSPVPLAKPLLLGFFTGWRCRFLAPGLWSPLVVVVLPEPPECLCVLGVQSRKQTDISHCKKERRFPHLLFIRNKTCSHSSFSLNRSWLWAETQGSFLLGKSPKGSFVQTFPLEINKFGANHPHIWNNWQNSLWPSHYFYWA